MNVDDAVTAVVAFADGDVLRVQEHEEGVEGGEAGGEGYGWAFEDV